MSDRPLGLVIWYAKLADGGGREPPKGYDLDDYADLGEADLPPSAAVRLADMTGRNVGFFEAVESIDHPGLDELERVDHE